MNLYDVRTILAIVPEGHRCRSVKKNCRVASTLSSTSGAFKCMLCVGLLADDHSSRDTFHEILWSQMRQTDNL